MLSTVEAYLALRRSAGFAMSNAEYLLKSFAAFATARGESHVHVRTAIDWAALGEHRLAGDVAHRWRSAMRG